MREWMWSEMETEYCEETNNPEKVFQQPNANVSWLFWKWKHVNLKMAKNSSFWHLASIYVVSWAEDKKHFKFGKIVKMLKYFSLRQPASIASCLWLDEGERRAADGAAWTESTMSDFRPSARARSLCRRPHPLSLSRWRTTIDQVVIFNEEA